MHLCEMRATPHLANEFKIKIKNKIQNNNDVDEIKRRHKNQNQTQDKNRNNQNVAAASPLLKLEKTDDPKMRQPVGKKTPQLPLLQLTMQLQLQLLLQMLLLLAGLNGLTQVAALKGKCQLQPLCILHIATFNRILKGKLGPGAASSISSSSTFTSGWL